MGETNGIVSAVFSKDLNVDDILRKFEIVVGSNCVTEVVIPSSIPVGKKEDEEPDFELDQLKNPGWFSEYCPKWPGKWDYF